MVNSNTSFGSERNGNTNASYVQEAGLHKTSSSPLAAKSAVSSKSDLLGTDDGLKVKTVADQLRPSEAKFVDLTVDSKDVSRESSKNLEIPKTKTTLFCSFPLEKVQTILAQYGANRNKMKVTRKVLCLYCDRTFVNVNLRQKHVERCHSAKHLRRASLRKQNILTSTPCLFCDQFTSAEHTLKDLFKHLVDKHSKKYFGCVFCEVRFLNSSHLADHNLVCPSRPKGIQESTADQDPRTDNSSRTEDSPVKIPRRKQKTKKEDKSSGTNASLPVPGSENQRKQCDAKNLRSKKLSVKSSRMILKRSKRLQAKVSETVKKKRTRELNDKKRTDRLETFSSKLNEKTTKAASSFVNPYPEFDHFFQVKKITDHSIDNLKISSLTFDDVFDKAFFNRIKCNIQENLLHHIDGKLFKNEESESRISNFEKNANIPQETQNLNSENYGCELSLNAIAPTTMLLSNQLGDDPESQIEYGSKPSKKKTQLKKDEVHYKYFTRRKYQASILEHKENRDLSKLDMWTQYVIKRRQQKIQDDKRSPKEILDYFAGEEYKSMLRREELNRVLDRRGPFEDLKEEVSKKAALDKLNGDSAHPADDNANEIGELMNDILSRVFDLAAESAAPSVARSADHHAHDAASEIPSYLNLRPTTDVVPENEIDRSDRIALICSSQETENFELPSNTVRGKNEKVELTGEWARSRIYICAACGLKLQNIKQFLEHKSAAHQYIWVQHYEFVGNQSQLYRHLSIPVLGKVGVLENSVQCKVWRRSDARSCTKCGKQCNSLGELHRHILECGGDWTWMLARKKCKYRPFGAKSRRKRRGLVKRIYAQKSDVSPTEKKTYKKSYDIPRQKPSDADTIKRMLANLPAKRASRKIISLKDGFNPPRTRQVQTTKQSKYKCGKLVRQQAKEQHATVKNSQKQHNGNHRRSLRCLGKVLSSRILDTKPSMIVRRKLNNGQKKNGNLHQDPDEEEKKEKEAISTVKKVTRATKSKVPEVKEESRIKRSPRIEKHLNASEKKITIKQFFPVKKKKKSAIVEDVKDSPEVIVQKNVPEEIVKSEELSPSVNLRKRKIGVSEGLEKAKVEKKKTVKKRKLRNTRSNVESSLEVNVEPPTKTPPEANFFGDSVTQETADVDLPADPIDVVDCESQKEPQEEKVEKIVEEIKPEIDQVDLEKKVETVEKVNIVSPTKRKIKKPIRGLNDCIAMLTSKLGKSFVESATDSIFNNNGAANPVVTPSDTNRKTEYLLKVPFSNEHFHLRINHDETGIADACGHDSKLPDEDTEEKIEEAALPEETMIEEKMDIPDVPDVVEEATSEINLGSSIQEEVAIQNEELEEVQEVVEDVNVDVVVPSVSDEVESGSDSEDEVPLSALLRNEQSTSSCESKKVDEEIQEVLPTPSSSPSLEVNNAEIFEENATETNVLEDMTVDKDISQNEERVTLPETEIKLTKKKDVAVLTEINANFCEHSETLTSNFEAANKLEPINRRILEIKADDSVLLASSELLLQKPEVEEKLNSISDAKDMGNLGALEQQIFCKLDKLNFFVKNSFDSDGASNELCVDPNVDEVQKLESDTSEYKENVIGKYKQKKKTGASKSVKSKVKQTEVDARKVSKIDSVARLEESSVGFAESELTVEEVAKSPVDLVAEREPKEKQVADGARREEIIEDRTLSELIKISDQTVKFIEDATENVKELRRSSRNARRITSYNETDLIDPLLDDLESDRTISRILRETTKDIFGLKRKSRSHKKIKNGHNERKLNGEELFDLLKATPNENIVLSKPPNTYFNSFDEISNDFNDDNFDVFEDILEKSIAVIDENLSQPLGLATEETMNDSQSASIQNSSDSNPKTENRKKGSKKKKNSKHKNKKPKTVEEFSKEANDVENITNDSDVNTKDAADKLKVIYCEICDKSFSRVESLTKHKRTLTHISKLSELEAKEAASKTQCDPKSTNEESETAKDLNLLDMLASVDEEEESKQCPSPFDVTVRNSNLKLADIINDVLNKPMSKKDEDVASSVQKDEAQVEVRRCKSLAERKSFESESFKNVDYFSPEISNAAAGTILEKQITLLENIIENRSTMDYIDEISVSSSPSLDKNSSECKMDSAANDEVKESKASNEDSFLKPSQYEEISEDSNLRTYDEQKSRKVLNRDEELFLECCSLLKSGSEVSSYSKKSNNVSKDVSKPPSDESDWLETNYLSQQGNSDFAECYSDSSRIRTPLGDSFSQDSNSATLSSQWNMNNSCTSTKKQIWKEDLKLKGKNLTFEEVFGSKDGNNLEDLHSMVSSFDRVISEVLNTELNPASERTIKRSMEDLPREPNDHKDASSADRRKLLTKGAMKIFEGLRVSIPTEDLNMDKILVSGSPTKASSFGSDLNSEEVAVKMTKSVKNKIDRKPTKSGTKASNFKKQNDQQPNSKIHDIYDFEETQDNSDVFTKPDFRSFRNSSDKSKKPEQEGSDDDSRDCTDPFSFDAMSSSTSSVSEVSPVKSKSQQNTTKTKCMIMGRIFKNVVVKSKVVEDDIRSIPVIDNTKLVENFVLNCPEPDAKKPRMTEEELNLEFDRLISKPAESKQPTAKTCSNKSNVGKRKQKVKNRKRTHCDSDSSDDEFKLQKPPAKRTKKKTANTEKDNCINLEQELRECIGVASRKSQRKCTSGKQNVLIEYWSSDESSFEALLEKQIVNSVQQQNSEEAKIEPTKISSNESVGKEAPPLAPPPPPPYEAEPVGKKASSRANRRKRVAANPLYHWSSSSEDESRDLIEVRPLRDEVEDDDRPVQHGWIVGDSPKKLVTMLAQAKGKKIDIDSVKEHGRKRPSVCS